MLIRFRWFGLRKSRKPSHMPSHLTRPQWIEPDVMDLNHRPPTIHSARMEAEFARLKRQELHRFRLQQLRQEIAKDVEHIMSQPLHLDDGQHDAPTTLDQAHKTDKIPNPEEEP